MSRRYATYQFDPAIAPLAQVTLWHQAASVGALLITLGFVVLAGNIVQSWFEGPAIEDGDPWNLREANMLGRDYAWFSRKQEITQSNGGEAPHVDE